MEEKKKEIKPKEWPEVVSKEVDALVRKYANQPISPETFLDVVADLKKLTRDQQVEFFALQFILPKHSVR